MAFAEGLNTWPTDTSGQKAWAVLDNATAGSALAWALRSAGAGDGLAAKFALLGSVALWNGATVDRWASKVQGVGRVSYAATTLNTGTVSVATSSTTILTANAPRKAVTVTNLDATNPVFLKGAAGATTTDFRLGPGVSKVLDYTGLLTAIATGSAVNVSYAEEVF